MDKKYVAKTMRVTLIAPVFVSAFYSYISFLANTEKLLVVGIKKQEGLSSLQKPDTKCARWQRLIYKREFCLFYLARRVANNPP